MTYVRGAQRKVRVMLAYTVHHPVVREETWEDVELIRGTLVFVLTGPRGLAQAQLSPFRDPGFAPEEIPGGSLLFPAGQWGQVQAEV